MRLLSSDYRVTIGLPNRLPNLLSREWYFPPRKPKNRATVRVKGCVVGLDSLIQQWCAVRLDSSGPAQDRLDAPSCSPTEEIPSNELFEAARRVQPSEETLACSLSSTIGGWCTLQLPTPYVSRRFRQSYAALKWRALTSYYGFSPVLTKKIFTDLFNLYRKRLSC